MHRKDSQSSDTALMKQKMESSLVVLLLLQLCGLSAGLAREYIYVTKSMKWSEAQSYCRQMFTDLATITTDEEQNTLLQSGIAINSWIGLKRSKPLSDTWQWSDGQTPTYFNWNSDPTTHKNDDCVIIMPNGWVIKSCSTAHDFFCYRNLTLVKENKTWEEALEYCRTYHTALASLNLTTQLLLAETEPAQTASMWMGLRFLNGKWISVSGEEVSSMFSADLCPAPPYRCGAYNLNTHDWENRRCKENLNFLCY